MTAEDAARCVAAAALQTEGRKGDQHNHHGAKSNALEAPPIVWINL